MHSVTVMCDFDGYKCYTRKVGTRNAQAISKVALAGLVRLSDDIVTDIRIGAASLREVPTRLYATEQVLLHTGGYAGDNSCCSGGSCQ